MRVEWFEVTDPIQLSSGSHPFEGEMHQVESGNLDGWALGLLGGEIDVWLYSTKLSIVSRTAQRTDQLILTSPLTVDRPVVHNGLKVTNGELVEYLPGFENVDRFPPGLYLDLQIDAATARRRGWSRGGESIRRLPRSVLGAIRSECFDRIAERSLDSSARARPEDRALVSRLVELLDGRSLAPVASDPRASDQASIVRRAIERIEATPDDVPIRVRDLAEEARTSERTLYDVFRRAIGTSPYDYALSRRLNRLRRRLLEAVPAPGLVTRIAGELGFDHLGQLAIVYRRQFGETPSETLGRSNHLLRPAMDRV